MHITWMPQALDDLEDFGAYVACDSKRAAGVAVLAVLGSVKRLALFPASGRPGRVAGTRELVVPHTPLVIPYRVKGELIQILRVQHTSQEWRTQG
jgi:addiction module RelE/StbE family toxin